VNPSSIRTASAAVLIAVNVVWMNAAVRTPRTLIQVSKAIDAIAKMRCGDNPTAMSPIGCGKCRSCEEDVGGKAGMSTDVKRANATATAAIVPVDHDEQGPAVEVAEQRRDPFAQIDVIPARFGEHGRQLPIRQRAEQRHDTRQQPNGEEQGPANAPAGGYRPTR